MGSIEGPAECQPGIMQALGACRGEMQSTEEKGTRVQVEAFIPIAETIGSTPFATVLTQKTNGKAVVSYKFDHWENVPSDPLDINPKTGKANTKAAEIMLNIRQRKGLKLEAPQFVDYYDKL